MLLKLPKGRLEEAEEVKILDQTKMAQTLEPEQKKVEDTHAKEEIKL